MSEIHTKNFPKADIQAEALAMALAAPSTLSGYAMVTKKKKMKNKIINLNSVVYRNETPDRKVGYFCVQKYLG
ncbi:hypothetical protein HMPREF3217_01756 [Finegoldia magna]|nr:hypothetical protein HMPREF3217_01756 [Finegoldia magna]